MTWLAGNRVTGVEARLVTNGVRRRARVETGQMKSSVGTVKVSGGLLV